MFSLFNCSNPIADKSLMMIYSFLYPISKTPKTSRRLRRYWISEFEKISSSISSSGSVGPLSIIPSNRLII